MGTGSSRSLAGNLGAVKKAEDRGTGTTAFVGTKGIHCNVADTYELTFKDSVTAIDMILTDGAVYPYNVTNVLTTASGAIDAGDITLLY
tara:strand:+ start:428 stop:694 length:267 start_codon:yes stop_codon:yes gene_type:complete